MSPSSVVVSRFFSLVSFYNIFFSVAVRDNFFRGVLFLLLSLFLLLRVPYVFGVMGFLVFLIIFIFPLFVSLMITRLDNDIHGFFAAFVPSGTPIWIAPFVCLAETISYLVRPVVLLIRPFLNLTIGAFGGAALGYMFLKFGSAVIFFLIILFFYEIFVALVHWFIVCEILSFSVDH